MKTYTLTKQLEEKEIQLKQKYNARKLKLESKAIEVMKINPKYFYNYARQSSKTTSLVAPAA